MLSSMASDEVLQIIGDWNILRLYCTQEVLHDRVCIVALTVSARGPYAIRGNTRTKDTLIGPSKPWMSRLLHARWYVSCFLIKGISSLVVQPFVWKSS